MFELFSVLQLFEEWKDDVGGFTSECIARQTYDDTVVSVRANLGLRA